MPVFSAKYLQSLWAAYSMHVQCCLMHWNANLDFKVKATSFLEFMAFLGFIILFRFVCLLGVSWCLLEFNCPISELQITSAPVRLRSQRIKITSTLLSPTRPSARLRFPRFFSTVAYKKQDATQKKSTHFLQSLNPNWARKQAKQVSSVSPPPFLLFLPHSPICLALFWFQPLVECKYSIGLTTAPGMWLQHKSQLTVFLSRHGEGEGGSYNFTCSRCPILEKKKEKNRLVLGGPISCVGVSVL